MDDIDEITLTGVRQNNFDALNSSRYGLADAPVFVCFRNGTLILTTHGEVAVEDLRVGDMVITRDHGRAMRFAKRLDFGCVWINTHIPIVAEMPHGGFKHSGYGKDLSSYGFEDYTRIKHVMSFIG